MSIILKRKITKEIRGCLEASGCNGGLLVISRNLDESSFLFGKEFNNKTNEFKWNCIKAETKAVCSKGNALDPMCLYFNIKHCDDPNFVKDVISAFKKCHFKRSIAVFNFLPT